MSEQPCPFYFRVFLPATRSRIARRNFSRSAGLPMSSLRFIASATVLAYEMPCCSTNLSQRSSAITSIRLETERFSKDAICSSLFRCSSRTDKLSFGLFLFFLDFAIRSFLHLVLHSRSRRLKAITYTLKKRRC